MFLQRGMTLSICVLGVYCTILQISRPLASCMLLLRGASQGKAWDLKTCMCAQELRLVQKVDRNNKNVMWCFAEFSTTELAARTLNVLQVLPSFQPESYYSPSVRSYARTSAPLLYCGCIPAAKSSQVKVRV